MTTTSFEFAIFTLVTLVLYYVVSRKMQNQILLIASYIFLISWNIQFAIVFLILTVVNFTAAQFIARKGKRSKLALYTGIAFNIAALVFFKYADFFVPSVVGFLQQIGITQVEDGLRILLPLGLSFFIVQTISYLLDVNRGITVPASSFVQFAVYMVYFPRVISGPIERYREFQPLLQETRNFDRANLDIAFILILQGLVRKVVIANLLFLLVPLNIFSQPGLYQPPHLALWLLVYTFALYNDFAGYTLLARGVSALFGIPLSANFNAPYTAQGFSDFWQRWHITLSNWLRDYIFMPVTRNLLRRKFSRNHAVSIVLPPMTTMFVSALWHSASLNMLIWGGMHGVYLVAERGLTLARPVKRNQSAPKWRQYASVLIVFILVALAWVPFRTALPEAITYWSILLSPASWLDALRNFSAIRGQVLNRYTLDAIVLITISILLDFAHLRLGEQALQRFPVLVQAIIINMVILALIIASIAQNRPPAFVYQGF